MFFASVCGIFPSSGGCSWDDASSRPSKSAIAAFRWRVELSAACFCSSNERLRSRYRERSSLTASSSWKIGSTGFASSPRLSTSVFEKCPRYEMVAWSAWCSVAASEILLMTRSLSAYPSSGFIFCSPALIAGFASCSSALDALGAGRLFWLTEGTARTACSRRMAGMVADALRATFCMPRPFAPYRYRLLHRAMMH